MSKCSKCGELVEKTTHALIFPVTMYDSISNIKTITAHGELCNDCLCALHSKYYHTYDEMCNIIQIANDLIHDLMKQSSKRRWDKFDIEQTWFNNKEIQSYVNREDVLWDNSDIKGKNREMVEFFNNINKE